MIASGTSGDACRGDLLGQSRRGALTDAGRLALDAHLAACASCRLSRDVLADFDQVDVVDIRDGARIRALVDMARGVPPTESGPSKGPEPPAMVRGEQSSPAPHATARGRARSQTRLRAAAAAAVLIVCGGSASAAVWWWRRPTPPAPIAVAHRTVAPRVDAPRAPSRPQAAPAAAAETPPPAVRVAVPAPAPRHRAIARNTVAPVEAPHLSAGALLAEAGRARGEGQLDRAVSLYRKLQREFPGTPEAQVSTVPLGRLLLDAASPRAALAAFDAYLRDVPRGPLIAEALYGRGRALEALGEDDEERRAWERLVTDHGGSAYAPHARRRLATLR